MLVTIFVGKLFISAAKKKVAQQNDNAPAAEAVIVTEAPVVETEAPETEAALVVDTQILMEADSDMLNTYSVIAVNPEAPFVDADGNAVADVAVNTAGADAFQQWLVRHNILDKKEK